MSKRNSFYPLPPSLYPRPILDPAPAYETAYASEHCAQLPKDRDFYRSRTLNPEVMPPDATVADNTVIYPRHGKGAYTLPYYRRDSKGFRTSYAQKSFVDQEYIARDQWRRSQTMDRLGASVQTWAHPSSRPNYRDGPLGNTRGYSIDAKLGTDYRGAMTARALASANGRSMDVGPVRADRPNTALSPAEQARQECYDQLAATQAATRRQQRTAILGDPLLVDPLSNSYRKSRTVYKRSFGQCR
jgi:hypothetical protein